MSSLPYAIQNVYTIFCQSITGSTFRILYIRFNFMDLLSREGHFILIRYLRKISELEIGISDETVKTTRGKDSPICTKGGLYQRPLLTAVPVGEISERKPTCTHVHQGIRDGSVRRKARARRRMNHTKVRRRKAVMTVQTAFGKFLYNLCTHFVHTYLYLMYIQLPEKRSLYSV